MNETANVSRASDCPAQKYVRVKPEKKSREEKTEESREKKSKEIEERSTEPKEDPTFDTITAGARDPESAEQVVPVDDTVDDEPVEKTGDILDSSKIELTDYSMRVAMQNRLAANSTSDYASTTDMILEIMEGQNSTISDLFRAGSRVAEPFLNILA